jgi:hypothetical protein
VKVPVFKEFDGCSKKFPGPVESQRKNEMKESKKHSDITYATREEWLLAAVEQIKSYFKWFMCPSFIVGQI